MTQFMTRSNSSEFVLFDPEIERTLQRRRRQQQEEDSTTMDNQEVNADMEQRMAQINQQQIFQRAARNRVLPGLDVEHRSIVAPPIAANNFELKPSLINMVQRNQFGGAEHEDPQLHLDMFLEICELVKLNGVPADAIKLKLFPFTLTGKSREWLRMLPHGSITTWAQLREKFLTLYFPPTKINAIRNNIFNFGQLSEEPFHEAWGRYKKLLNSCPHHGLDSDCLLQSFFTGANPVTKAYLNASSGGILMGMEPTAALRLIEDLASSDALWGGAKTYRRA